jgi:serine/threonine protein kinase
MPFTIEATINESSTTRVYRAFDETLHRRVLLKVLHKHLANDQQLRERFVREARACAALRSQYIVQVFDLTEIDGAPAIVMEYIDGKSLKDVIADDALRTPALASKVALHVLRGLSVAHNQQIIHRDIKPGNILVAADGTVKVTDFGLARIAVAPTVTLEGMLIGTPAYIAPEQIRGEQPDARADLFSLGTTLIETLSGERLFEGATYAECLNKVATFRPEMLDRFTSNSSPEFIEFCKRLMHPDKHRRFASADEALAALQNQRSITPAASRPALKQQSTQSYIIITALLTIGVVLYGVNFFVHRSTHQTNSPLEREGIIVPTADSAKRTSMPPPSFNASSEKSNARQGEATLRGKQDSKPFSDEYKASMDSGSVRITSTPWAKVFVDNKLIGETPLDAPVFLALGTHTIVFTHPSFEPMIRTITITGNVQLVVNCNFLESAGFLNCTARPWAEIFVDDVFKDTTPLAKAILLSAGKHRARFHNPSFQDIYRDITIAAQDTLNLSIAFSR